MSWPMRVTCPGSALRDRRLKGVTLEIAGLGVPLAEYKTRSWPAWWIVEGLSTAIKIQQVIVSSPSTPLYGEIRWLDDGQERMSIHGLEDQRHKADDPKRITDWLLAVRVRVRRRGPGKNTRGYFSGPEEFEAVLRVAMRHVHRHDPPILITKVARAFKFTHKSLKTSYRQLYAWLKRYEIDFEATKLSIESESL